MKNFGWNLEKISWQAIFIFTSIFFFVLNLLLPFVADDFLYAFVWTIEVLGGARSELEWITSFTDIFPSLGSYYFTWSGRLISLGITHIFSWIGKMPFNVLNTVMFCALLILIFKLGTGLTRRDMNVSYALFLTVSIYLFTPEFCIAMLWMTGAVFYLWMTVFGLLFLLPFVMKYRDKNFWLKPPRWSIPVMAVSGLIAGWSLEPSACIILFVTFWFMVKFWHEGNVQTWMKVGVIFFVVGFLLLVLSPGSVVRARFTFPNLDEISKIEYVKMLLTSGLFFERLYDTVLSIIARESPLFLPIIFYFTSKTKSRDKTLFILNFLAAAILMIFVMAFSPEYPQRAAFPSHIFIMIASIAALQEILPSLKRFYASHELLRTGMKIFSVALLLHMSACAYVFFEMNSQWNTRLQYALEHREDELIVVPPLKLPSWSETFIGQRTWTSYALMGADLQPSAKAPQNIDFARYFRLNKIAVDPNSK